MKQDGIDVSQIDAARLPRKVFPAAHRFRIFISRQAHDAIWKHARETLPADHQANRPINEVGGVLIGDIYGDEEGPFLEVRAAIAAKHTRTEHAQVTFTPETWADINQTKDERYPDVRIVGWYHTHPRFGVFLSERDRFIHRHSFSQPWAAAFVLDPIQQTEGFFVWSDGETRLAPEYWIGQERRDRSFARRGGWEDESSSPAPLAAAAGPEPSSAVSRASFALAVACGFLALLFLSAYVYLREVGHAETEKFVLRAIEAQKAELKATYYTLHTLQADFDQSRKQTAGAETQIREKIRRLDLGLNRVAEIAVVLQQRVSSQQLLLERIPLAVPVPQQEQQPPGPQTGKPEAKKAP